jgi:ABC-type uncharacterized transport system YnjBCD substrate-binding protein
MFCGMPRKQVKEFEVYGEVNSVGIVFPEPTPVGLGDLIYVPRQAKHPNAAIVFLAWSATQEAQNALDDIEFTGHPAFEGNEVSKILKGKKAVFGNWEYAGRAGEILAEILQALGIPVVQ